MLITVPSRVLAGVGRIVPCDVCMEDHALGSMMAVESEYNGDNMIKQCCSLICLLTVIQHIQKIKLTSCSECGGHFDRGSMFPVETTINNHLYKYYTCSKECINVLIQTLRM